MCAGKGSGQLRGAPCESLRLRSSHLSVGEAPPPRLGHSSNFPSSSSKSAVWHKPARREEISGDAGKRSRRGHNMRTEKQGETEN